MSNHGYLEIERKFLVKALPLDYKDYPHKKIAQSYLSLPGNSPVLRVRRYGEEYLLTVKKKSLQKSMSCHEVEFPIEQDVFEQLKLMAEERNIDKTRYFIPWENKSIELDIFSGSLSGLVLAEIEYDSLEEVSLITLPDWFGEEVTYDFKYSNNYLSEFGLT